MAASAVQLPLKIKTDSKFYQFMEWYEAVYGTVNPDTGRKRKGNCKKFIIEEFEKMLIAAKPSNELVKTLEEFKQSTLLSPELQAARQSLNQTEFAKFVELMEKVKNA